MNNKKIQMFLLLVLLTILHSFTFSISANNDPNPLTLELTESNGDISDYIEISFDEYQIKGSHLGIKLNPEYAIDQNGLVPSWSMFNIILFDSEGNTYSTSQPASYTTSNPDFVPAFSNNGSFTEVVWGYSYFWPKLGFYGTVYLPYYKLDSGTIDNPSLAPQNITKIRITHNSKANARKSMITHFFELIDATLMQTIDEVQWIGDVLILEDFNEISSDNIVEKHGTILDFSKLKLDSKDISFNQNAKMFARKMTIEELNNLNLHNSETDLLKTWKSKYTVTGQKFSYLPFDNGIYKQGLKWQYGNYLIDYDSSLNSYGSLNIKAKISDWQKALGLTIWVKNPQPYPVSFNLEFNETEEGGVERWNLNNQYYRKIYAFDTNTQEEFSFHSLTVCVVPAQFEGWLRIPFSEYEVPEWSLAYSWTDGILDFKKPHPNVYITSQFIVNDSVTFYFDNIGLYFEDFQVGKLFDRTKPSIKECLELSKYSTKGR